jgi:hypothetical protein
MKDLISNDKATIAALADRLKRAQSHSEYQRIQCVLIRATLGSSAKEIAQLQRRVQSWPLRRFMLGCRACQQDEHHP